MVIKIEQAKSLDSIEAKLDQVDKNIDPMSWNNCCIYKLPWCMKVEDNDKAYMPHLVSLGPHHYGKDQLQAMEFHKYRALHRMLKRNNQDITTYLREVKEVEQEALACYEDIPHEFPINKFAEVLVVDGCFILEILLCYHQGFEKLGYPKKDPVFSKEFMKDGILRDMILLENQIPLFVLDRLHGLNPNKPQNQEDVVELAISIYNPFLVTDRCLTREEFESLKKFIFSSRMHHCLDIFRQTLMYHSTTTKSLEMKERKDKDRDPKDQLISSATQLKDAGVKFKVVKKSFPFWDVNFDHGTMNMPQIVINDTSESMFLNLMAFEQSHLPPNQAQITSYIALLDNLVDSPSDVAHLIDKEIIVHTLGSNDEVANLLNRLAKGIYFSVDDGCFVGLYERVNKYSSRKCNQWRATLMRDYFSSPWSIIALIGAILGLALTFVQTFNG